ncbi:MAG: polysaccharide deacetylase family protein [Bacteroidales bacterium]|nr:polysaccharide deacetylase family protein [Bacteroidales bacterium]
MNDNLKKLIFSFSSALHFNSLKKINPQKLIFPFYHAVSDEVPIHLENLYPIKSVNEFVKDLDFLVKNYNVVDFEKVKAHLNGSNIIVKPSFFLSFDDGLSEVYDIIAPILKQKGVPAAFFVNSDFVDNKDLFYRYKLSIILSQKNKLSDLENYLKSVGVFNSSLEKTLNIQDKNVSDVLKIAAEFLNIDFYDYLKKYKPYMTINQLKELSDNGFVIGAHSKSHLLYEKIGVDEQLSQTIDSLNFIVENFNPLHKLFAFPFSDNGIKMEFFEKLFSENIVDFTFGTAGIKKDSFAMNIQRIPMENGNSAKKNLKYQYFYYFLRSLLNKNVIER